MTIVDFPGNRGLGPEAKRDTGEPVVAVIDLRGLIGALWRRLGWIAGTVAVVALVGLAVAMSIDPYYEARSQILVDTRGLSITNNELAPRQDAGGGAVIDLESRLRVLTSNAVLRQVADELELANDPEFNGGSPGIMQRVLSVFGSSEEGVADRDHIAFRNLQRRVRGARVDGTYILEVTARTGDPDKSALIANAVAVAFLEENRRSSVDTAARMVDSMTGRVDELRARLEESERRVEEYKARENIVGASGMLVNEQQLGELNKELALARGQAAEHRARYEEIQRLQESNAAPEAIVEAVESATIAALRAEFTKAKALESEALEVFGPRHPRVLAASAQANQVLVQIDDELGRLAGAARSAYERSSARIRSLEGSLDSAMGQVVGDNSALVRLRVLEREVESSRAIYEAVLQRTNQLGEQQALTGENIRIISPALAPDEKAGPPRILIMLASLAFGGMLGIGAGLLREQFDSTVRSGEQLESETGLQALVSLPHRRPGAPIDLGGLTSPRALGICRLYGVLRRTGPGRVIALVSAEAEASRAAVAADLARVAGCYHDRILLVTSDERSTVFGGSPTGQNAHGDRDLHTAVTAHAGSGGEWTRGADPEGTAAARSLDKEEFGLVVIESGIQLGSGRVRELMDLVDDVVLVVEAGVTRRETVLGTVAALGEGAAKLRGAVLVG